MDCHLECEDTLEVDGISNMAQVQIGIMENPVSLEEESEDTQSFGVSQGSSPILAEKVPETPLFILASNFQSGVIKIMLPFEEDLVQAQNS